MMNEMLESSVRTLLGLLERTTSRMLPLHVVKQEMQNSTGCKAGSRDDRTAADTIRYVLDNWLVDKVIDCPEYNNNGYPVGSPVWLFRLLSPEESQRLEALSPTEKAVLKILRECNDPDNLGAMSEENLLSELRKMGFDAEWVPAVMDRIDDFFDIQDDGRLVRWWRIVPEYNKTEEHKRMLDELREKVSRWEEIQMGEHDEGEDMDWEDEELYDEDD